MHDRIYCPKCDGAEHEKHYTTLYDHHWTVKIVNWWRESLIVPLSRRLIGHGKSEIVTQEQSYTPERYHCRHCGHQFLSASTYDQEILWANKHKRSGLILGSLLALQTVCVMLYLVLSFIEGYWDEKVPYAIGLLVFSIAICAIAFSGAMIAAKRSKRMVAERKEFLDTQAKHTNTVYSRAGEQIPTWKRLQLEQEQSRDKA